MKLNNSIKLAVANFAMFWKILLYKTIAFGLSFLLVLPIFSVLKQAFYMSNFTTLLGSAFTSSVFQNITTVMGQLLALINAFFEGIKILASTNVVALIYLVILVFVIIPFLFKLSDVPASESAYSYLSSLSKNSFTINFVSMLDKSIGYSILRTVFEIPFVFALGGGIYGILNLSTQSQIMAIISPLIMFVFIVALCALNCAFFNGWAPSIVVFNCCAGKGFKKGIKAVKRNFFPVLSSFVVVITLTVALFYLFGVYSLIVIIPLFALINAVFGQVLFFESQGMNYYLSPEKIVSPRKLECADSIKKVKNII